MENILVCNTSNNRNKQKQKHSPACPWKGKRLVNSLFLRARFSALHVCHDHSGLRARRWAVHTTSFFHKVSAKTICRCSLGDVQPQGGHVTTGCANPPGHTPHSAPRKPDDSTLFQKFTETKLHQRRIPQFPAMTPVFTFLPLVPQADGPNPLCSGS